MKKIMSDQLRQQAKKLIEKAEEIDKQRAEKVGRLVLKAIATGGNLNELKTAIEEM